MNAWIGMGLVVLLFVGLVIALDRLEKTSLRCLDLEAENTALLHDLELNRCPTCEIRREMRRLEERGTVPLAAIITPDHYESGKD